MTAQSPALREQPPPRPADASLAFTSYLRVAAMSAVVLIHAMSAIVGNGDVRGSLTWWLATALDLGVSWSVPVFIMVSGALLLAPRAGETPGAFYVRRLQRIAIPLVVAHVGYILVRWLWSGEQLTLARIVSDLLRANVYSQLYFFWIVLGLYLITPLLRPVLAAFGRRELVVIGSGVILWMWAVQASGVLLAQIGSRTTIWQPAALTLFIPYIGYFMLGYALRDVILSGRWLVCAIGLLVAADVVVVLEYGFRGANPAVSMIAGGGYQGLPVAITAIAIFVIGRSLITAGSPLAGQPFAGAVRYLGDLSLGVFMIHLAVLRLGWTTDFFNFSMVKRSLALDLLLWVVVLVVSFAVCALIARIPVLRKTIGL
jgi:surface polysaccharide O-acyltransferase-like enzyme